MTTVFLIRHGEVLFKTDSLGRKLIYGPEVHLNDLGRQQLALLGQQLKDDAIDIATIYSSPYARTQQSAEIIANYTNAPVITNPHLHDLWMPGWFGLPMDLLFSLHGDIHKVEPLSDDQETLDVMAKRIITTIDTLVTHTKGKTIAIVSHGDPLAIYIHNLLRPNSPPDTTRDNYYPAKGQALCVQFNNDGTLASCEPYKTKGNLPTIIY